MSGELYSLAGAVLLAGACGYAYAAEPVPAGPVPAAQSAPPSAPPQLDIMEFVVDGNSVLPDAVIVDTLNAYLGPGRSPQDVDRAREALENVYRERGYKTVSVSIPKQTVRDGSVQLLVTEGRVAHLNVVGSRYHSLDTVREQAPSLAEGTVPDFDAVKHDIVALNQQPDRRVTPALKAGATPGTVDIDLAVSDDLPVHGMLELNNRRSAGTSTLRSVASLSYDNLWQQGHSLSLSYQTAPQQTDDAKVMFGSYLARFHDSPFSLLINALKSDSDVATVGGINVLGKGSTVGVRGLWTLPGDEELYQSFSAGVDYKHYHTSVLLGTDTIETPLDYYPFSLAYNNIWHRPGVLLASDLTMTFASMRLGSDSDELEINRTFTRGQQFSLRGGVSYTASLPLGMETFMRTDGQWTDQPLVTNEQYSAGGADTVRGYYEAESVGDYGLSQIVELRSPSLANSWLDQLQVFVFFDDAVLKMRRATPGTPVTSALLSSGAGVNFKLLSTITGSVDWAIALDGGPYTQNGDSRVLFRVQGSF
ncbi:ShlB/FhaC/HecB family hemolysin secretion/activation protein [Hydrocarboniphaga sp.]|uniref:ShlB/FhaC/HecB family hemolysin secretion/activation protein n=1 Tax=Hydrocarboniphaga sp. TaxID=2033016 RepID=UPI00260E03A4|nr:ShlB/FhaC/HecB family hemolysin secretion/activation protein [Hydrocarboniphaga sp.]